jgi:hypothetical protein
VLFSLCAFNELFFLLVYLHSFGPQWWIDGGGAGYHKIVARMAHLVFPFCALKHLMNFSQLLSASMVLVRLDEAKRRLKKQK